MDTQSNADQPPNKPLAEMLTPVEEEELAQEI